MSYRYTLAVSHPGLGKHRIITGTDQFVVESKARAQMAEWEARYPIRKQKCHPVTAKPGII